jgi:hypothetical protein
MLAHSYMSAENEPMNIVESTAAVMFLGTPHRGSKDLAGVGEMVRKVACAIVMDTNSAMLDANFKGFTFVDESSMDEHTQAPGLRDEYDDMDEDEKRDQDWDDSFDIPEKNRGDHMSDIVKNGTNEDSSIFNGSHFDM